MDIFRLHLYFSVFAENSIFVLNLKKKNIYIDKNNLFEIKNFK